MTRTALIAGLLLLAAPAAVAQDADLASRAQALADEAAIERLIHDYGRHLDAKDYATFAALFTDDGVWNGGPVGPEAIEAAMQAAFGDGSGAVWTTDHHVIGNIIVDLDGDSARAVSRWIFVSPGPDAAPKPVMAGRHLDTFVRTADGWRFSSRELVNDMAMENFPAVRAEWESD